MKGSTIPLTGFPGERPVDVLYESLTTRVFRQEDAAGSVICKEPLGPDAAQRLHHESNILARLDGARGVSQLASGPRSAGVLALRDCGGVPLAQVLRSGPLGIPALLALLPLLAQSVAAVHRAGVIHRNISPSNLLMSSDGEPVLIDFDLAMLAEQHSGVTHQGRIVGTLGYLAPEQTRRAGHTVDQRADLYSLGACFYEMATGRPPFQGTDTLLLILDHLVREPVAPHQLDPRVPRGLSDIIMRLLAKAPQQRFQSAEGLLHDLERLREDLSRGSDGSFALGERDFPARLAAPEQLVGRDAERMMLRTALGLAMDTTRRTVLVEGAAGVGKSALVNELRPVVAIAGGWFVHGKFDQYQRDGATAGGLTQALRALGRLLLAETKDDLDLLRPRILEALGHNAALMTHTLPEFDLLLGAQPEVPEVDPRQAESRFLQTVLDLLGAIVSPQRPLVIVLDDLQWAGEWSLRTFEQIMNGPALRGLLLVGAYRGGDVGPSHALWPLLARWSRQESPPQCLALQNLTPDGTGELVGRILRLSAGRAAELGQAVGALTAGNPFDTVEMINALRKDGVLCLGRDGWQWESAAIRRFVGHSTVVDLLSVRLDRLPPESRLLLEYMSCMGGSVEHELLQLAAGLDADELPGMLRAPLEDGLLAADANGLLIAHFRHDRVQQAVLAGLDEAQRIERQFEMARRLASQPQSYRHAAQQYLACVARLRDPHEQHEVALLFHGAAVRLARRADHALAERYLAAAGALLAALDDAADAGLRFSIDVARHAVLYSLGRLDEADAFHARAQAGTADPLELVEPTCLQIRSLHMRGRIPDAFDLGLALLGQLGLEVPQDFRDPTTQRRLDALRPWVMQDREVDAASRAPIQGRRLLGIANLLNRVLATGFYLADAQAQLWLTLEAQRLWAEHGPCAALVSALSRTCIVLINARGDYRCGFDIVRHVLAVGAAHGFEPETSEGRHAFSLYASHWFEPLEDTFRHAMRARQGLEQQGGDSSFSCFTYRVTIQALLECDPTLARYAVEIETGMALSRRTGNNLAATMTLLDQQLLRALRGQTLSPGSFADAQFDEDVFAGSQGAQVIASLTYCLRRAPSAVLFEDAPLLDKLTAQAMPMLACIPGFYLTVHAHLLRALALARKIQDGGQGTAPGDSTPLLSELAQCRLWLAARAADQPHNFLHLLHLVEAEEAWATGGLLRAAARFDLALREAQGGHRPWHRALVTERAAHFHLAQEWTLTGRRLLAEARDLYQGWGASAKVVHMQLAHPFLEPAVPSAVSGAGARSGAISTDTLDFMGVLRASQALSSETSLERLTARVSEVLAALTGATGVSVISWHDEQWWLLASASQERASQSIPVAQAAELGLLPLTAVRYAERTDEPLLVDDALRDDRFARDPYFDALPLCSLLVAPISSQGATRAMLILENRQGRAAFSEQRLDAVMLIAGQLAVSLANAQLYESLEQRVQARTRELEETQAQLVSTARRAGRAEIANNVLHNVGNVLNSINVSASVVRRSIGNSRIDGLTRAVALINEHEHDLSRFVESDPQGKALLVYLNELVSVLRTERDNTLNDLDRLARSVDHITYVVSTQQSHAGPSSVLELAQPQELMEEALRLSAEAVVRCNVSVVRHYDDVPTATLDRQRLLQILVNLIGNAALAMENIPEELRQLTLRVHLVRAEGATRLCIAVQDQGEGIAPENLTRIFAHGFTTRKTGHGFGLHSSVLAAREMGGTLTARSDGPGRGAVFTLEMPIQIEARLA